jgi:NitT/TauT family transport system substrate-binding protein
MALTGAAAYVGFDYGTAAAAEPPPETTRIRFFGRYKAACWVPQYIAEDLLRKEGFTDIQYIKGKSVDQAAELLQAAELDISLGNAAWQIKEMNKAENAVFIAGLHTGCYSLIGSEKIKSVRDLKGKKVWAWTNLEAGPIVFFKSLVAYVGLDPEKDFEYISVPKNEAIELFKKGEIDAFISFPPGPQQLQELGIGRVLVDTNVDRPWSQYFCCMVNASKKFVRKNPIAAKRALRALLKSNDIVARDPELATRVLIETKIRTEAEYKHILQALKEIPWSTWRYYNPEDTIRFYGLRLYELGLAKWTPQEIIDNNTDWRYLKSLKKELNITFT